MRTRTSHFCYAAFILLAVFVTARAGAPQLVSYQGRLTNLAGLPVADGNYNLNIRIYDAPTLGTVIWHETHTGVPVSGGVFSILLGSVNSPSPFLDATVFSDTSRWLGITVGADPEISQRTRLTSVPYAFRVATIDGSSGGSISGNVNLEASTATVGNIYKNGLPYIHTYGVSSIFLGVNAGNLTTNIGFGNTACGDAALNGITSCGYNTAIGASALHDNQTGDNNTALGAFAMNSNVDGIDNTACGSGALGGNSSGNSNVAVGLSALQMCSGSDNTACGADALFNSTSGYQNTAIGSGADVSSGALSNATAIGSDAIVNASNKIRLGNSAVTVIEGQVAYTFTSDKNQKENFQTVNGNDVLRKIRAMNLTSWNYKNQDPQQFRHYGPMAQEFYAAFGNDGFGRSGTETTINSGDMSGIMMIAIQALEKEREAMKAENIELKQRLSSLELDMRAELESLRKQLAGANPNQ